MTPQLSDEMLSRLSAFATAEYGLRFPPDRWGELARGVASAALELGVSDLERWAEEFITGSPSADDRAAVANHLTVSETYFFRQRETFTVLEKEILPRRLAERRQHLRALRIWSAGCASGEEPYSVAILLRQRFPEVRPEMTAILGTDINGHVLERATRGVYSEWSFRDSPDWLKPGYFTRQPRSRYQLTSEIRGMVRFSRLNLAAPFYPGEFGERADLDVILCRNVLMYFSAEWQDRILRRFAQALAPGGSLLVGPCDITAAQCADLKLRLSRPGIYEKPRAGEFKAEERANPPAAEAPAGFFRPLVPEVDIPGPAESSPSSFERRSDPTVRQGPAEPVTVLPQADGALHVARAHADRGELDEALTACDSALRLNNECSALHQLRGCILLEMRRLTEAQEAFRRVVYFEPDSAMAEYALGSIAQRLGRSSEAQHHFSVVLRLLAKHQPGEAVPHGEGLTVARLRDLVGKTLNDHAA